MELKKLIEELKSQLFERVVEDGEDFDDNRSMVTLRYDTEEGSLDIGYWLKNGDCEVDVYHDKDGKPESTNLEEFLSKALNNCVDRAEVKERWRDLDMDEWQSHGFADERDFWRWKEGTW